MKYPTLTEAAAANREQLCEWVRFLPTPGARFIGRPRFDNAIKREVEVLGMIQERLKLLGGFSAEISKTVGFDPR